MNQTQLLKSMLLINSILFSSLTLAGTVATKTASNPPAAPAALTARVNHTAKQNSVNYQQIIKEEALKNYKGQIVLLVGHDGTHVLSIEHDSKHYASKKNKKHAAKIQPADSQQLAAL